MHKSRTSTCTCIAKQTCQKVGNQGLKVTAHTWAIFFQKIDFFHFLIFCSTSYYKQNNAK